MRKLIGIIVIIIIVLGFSSIFVVQEGTRDIVFRFSKVMRDNNGNALIYSPGLHFKLPFVDSVRALDARIQTMNNQADRFLTKEKKDLIIDSFIKWRITDFNAYYLNTGGDVRRAETLLRQRFSDLLRLEIGRLNIQDVVTDSRGKLMRDVKNALNKASSVSDTSKISERKLGIEVVDVRIKQINLPQEISEAIFARMRAERAAVAQSYRAQGREAAQRVRATADYEVTKTVAEAEKQARDIRGQGDAIVAKMYAQSFSHEPDFYGFVRSLRAYENSFNHGQNVMVLSPDSPFFRYMGLSTKTKAKAVK